MKIPVWSRCLRSPEKGKGRGSVREEGEEGGDLFDRHSLESSLSRVDREVTRNINDGPWRGEEGQARDGVSCHGLESLSPSLLVPRQRIDHLWGQ
jgi:hypothetical protein